MYVLTGGKTRTGYGYNLGKLKIEKIVGYGSQTVLRAIVLFLSVERLKGKPDGVVSHKFEVVKFS